jgi:hypothetical protein
MNICKCTNKCTCKKIENIFLYDYKYTEPNIITKKDMCIKKSDVIIAKETFCLATDLEPKLESCINDDDDCISITSKDSCSSFDSWIETDELLDQEILRAKVVFKKKYIKEAN